MTLVELNIFHVMDALDETIAHSDRNDRDDLVRKNRMTAARAFTQQLLVMCVSIKADGGCVSGAYARVGTQVSAYLLAPASVPPVALGTLTPRFVQVTPKLVAVSGMALKFATNEMVKVKLHLIACSDTGDDEGGDHLSWCYGGFALASISDSGGTTYTVPHLLGAPQASRWCAAFVEAVCFYGQAVNV